MTVQTLRQSGTEERSYPRPMGKVWVRPDDWLPLPAIVETDNKFVGLHAIYENANFLALRASGNYTVDWGDGSALENVSSGVTAQHEYVYANISSATLCSRGYKQVIVTVVPRVGQAFTALNLHLQHSALSVYTSASGFLDIAIAGSSLTDIRVGLQQPGPAIPLINMSRLEQASILSSDLRQATHLFAGCSSLASIVKLVTSSTPAYTAPVVFTDAGDLVTLTGHGRRNGDSVYIISLVGTTGIAAATSYFVVNAAANTFQLSASYGGTVLPLTTNGTGVIAAGTTFANVFTSAYSLAALPLIDTSSVCNFERMFVGCYSLSSLPLLNTAAGVNFAYMLSGCISLVDIPWFDTSSGTNFSYMFSGLYTLTSQGIPLIDTGEGLLFTGMFYNCYALDTIPLFDTSKGVAFGSMFYNCYTLKSVPLLDTSKGTNFLSMFYYCYALDTIPLFDTSKGVAFGNMFYLCYSLYELPALNLSAATSVGSMFSACYSLSRIRMTGMSISFSVSACKLSAAALNEIYTNLPVASGKVITVTSNYGVSGDNPAIATAKGWAVTG